MPRVHALATFSDYYTQVVPTRVYRDLFLFLPSPGTEKVDQPPPPWGLENFSKVEVFEHIFNFFRFLRD